jgi:hypothetical protein
MQSSTGKRKNVKVTLRPTVSLGVKLHLGPKTRFLSLSDSCDFVDVGRTLWRENGSVICHGHSQWYMSSICSYFASWVLIQFLWWPLFCLLLTRPHSAVMMVMICWNTFATTVDMSLRGELFALGACTDWLATCWLCLRGGVSGLCNWGRLCRLLLLC